MSKDLKIKHGFTLAEVFSVHPKGVRKQGFTLAEVFSVHPKDGRKQAFTLAEVLITLGIIGVVAAMTLPNMIIKHQKKVVATRLKQTYSILQQAMEYAKSDYGDTSEWGINYEGSTISSWRTCAMDMAKTYFIPYLKGEEVAQYAIPIKRLGYKSGWKFINGLTFVDASYSEVFPYKLNNGAYLFFSMNGNGPTRVVYDMIIYADIDGPRGYNTISKDIFIFHLSLINSREKFSFGNSISRGMSRNSLINNCKNGGYYGQAYGHQSCWQLIINDNWQISDDYPW